jgi:hypothetical protein
MRAAAAEQRRSVKQCDNAASQVCRLTASTYVLLRSNHRCAINRTQAAGATPDACAGPAISKRRMHAQPQHGISESAPTSQQLDLNCQTMPWCAAQG